MAKSGAIARTLVGRITCDAKRIATRRVEVEWTRRHPRYGKVLRGQSVFQVHDAENASKKGDLVEIKEVSPISKSKSWKLVQILEKSE
jgi:small subunit ribosomal protein S17